MSEVLHSQCILRLATLATTPQIDQLRYVGHDQLPWFHYLCKAHSRGIQSSIWCTRFGFKVINVFDGAGAGWALSSGSAPLSSNGASTTSQGSLLTVPGLVANATLGFPDIKGIETMLEVFSEAVISRQPQSSTLVWPAAFQLQAGRKPPLF
jgi:hypothetical protein